MSRQLIIEADGGSRGNPGPSGSGAVVIDRVTGELLAEISEFIGLATNNVAEYRALLAAVKVAYDIDEHANVEVRMDSKLVIEQMSGGWKIKHPDMQKLAIQIHQVLAGRPVRWVWIPREQNARADALANQAMDQKSNQTLRSPSASHSSQTLDTPIASSVEFNSTSPSSVRAPGGVTKPLTTVILVRHGRTALTESKRISGSGGDDPGLSEAGAQDAVSAALELGKFGKSGVWSHLSPITAVVSSPMVRTRETAGHIARELDLHPQVIQELQEIAFGTWDGLTNEEAIARDPELFSAWQGSWDVAPPGGESLRDFDDRIRGARNQVLEQFAGQTVVLVAHVMPIRGFIRAALNADIEAYWRPQISPCSISVVRFWGGEAAEVVSFNSTHHLVTS